MNKINYLTLLFKHVAIIPLVKRLVATNNESEKFKS